jgi:lipopolysaccharide export system protein LptA
MNARLSYPLVAVLLATTVATAAYAQSKGGSNNVPSAFQGFARDNKEPVKIEANAFEVHDKDRYAIFTGNVMVQQGDSTMRSRDLKVYYEGSLRGRDKNAKEEAPPPPPKAAGAGSSDPAQRIRRLEALGGVIITNKDQKASGDLGVLDMPTNTATITGNVVLTQGPNVMRGDKLVVDLKTGFSRLESGAKDGNTRVQGLFVPSSVDTKADAKKGTGTK